MRAPRSGLVPLVALALGAQPAPAPAQHVGSEFQVNTYTTGDQVTEPGPRDASGGLVASDADGNFVVVWSSDDQDGHIAGIFAQRYDSNGEPQGSEFRVNSYTANGQAMPSTAMAANGDFVVVWASCCQDGDFQGIFGQRYDSEGTALGSEFRVNSYTTRNQTSPSVSSDADGNFVVVWTSDRQYEDGWGIFGQRFDKDGATQGSEFRVHSFTPNAQDEPAVAMASAGDFFVVWASEDQDGSDYGVFGQRYDRSGVPLGSEFRVNTYTTGFQDEASVAIDASGNFVVVWSGPTQEEGSAVLGQRYDGSGNALGEEFHVNSYSPGVQRGPSVARDASGNFIVVWHGDGQGEGQGVFGQRYDGGGTPLGVEFRLNSYTTGDQGHPAVAALGDSEFVVAWQSEDQDGSGLGVFGQRIDFGGDTNPPSVAVTAPNGGERLFTGSSYPIQWTASDETALSSFDVLVSVDGGGSFMPIVECQNLPGTATSCLWLAPGPPSANALVRVVAEDTSGNSASDDSDAVFSIVSGTGSVTVESPNSDVNWQVGSLQSIEWAHNLGLQATFRIDLDRDDDGSYEQLIAAAAPPDGAQSGSFSWTVPGPPSDTCRMRVSWTANLAVTDSSDVTFRITLDPSEFQVNTYTTFTQGAGGLASDAMGNFVVIWTGRGAGDNFGVFGQRFDSAGERLGVEFHVNSYTTGDQAGTGVASDASGNFVVVWQSRGQDGDGWGVFGQRFDSTGARRGAEFQVSAYATGYQYHPSVASDADGNFIVAWTTEHSSDYEDVYAKRYDSAGNALGTEFRVNSDTLAYQIQPSVASDADGNFVVVWRFADYRYGAAPDQIRGQRFDSTGEPRGEEFRVTADTDPDMGSPGVTSRESGDFVVVWQREGYLTGQEIYGRRFDSEGVPQGERFQVNSFTTGYQFGATAAYDASGSFLVKWSGEGSGDPDYGVFAQRYDSAGNPQGGEFRVNAHTTDRQTGGTVAARGNARFVAVWTSIDQDGSGAGVFGRLLDFSGSQAITVVSPNTNVKWRIGSVERIRWTHNLGANAKFRIELDRDDDGEYEELIAADAPVDGAGKGSFGWTVTGPPSGNARVRVSWTDDPSVSDASDVAFQIRPARLDR